MPMGTRDPSPDERHWIRQLATLPMIAGSTEWKERYTLSRSFADGAKITMFQARRLRWIVGRHISRLPKGAEEFSVSDIGAFPYTKRAIDRGVEAALWQDDE